MIDWKLAESAAPYVVLGLPLGWFIFGAAVKRVINGSCVRTEVCHERHAALADQIETLNSDLHNVRDSLQADVREVRDRVNDIASILLKK